MAEDMPATPESTRAPAADARRRDARRRHPRADRSQHGEHSQHSKCGDRGKQGEHSRPSKCGDRGKQGEHSQHSRRSKCGDRGEGVISAAIAVLIVAFLGAAMWVGFNTIWESAEEEITDQVETIGG